MRTENKPMFGSRAHFEEMLSRFIDVAEKCANLDTIMFEFDNYFNAWVAYNNFEVHSRFSFKYYVLSAAMDALLMGEIYKQCTDLLHMSNVYDRIIMAVREYKNHFDYFHDAL